MKKNISTLKDENTILDSYRIDLQNKKNKIIKELKHIKKEEENNNKPDTKVIEDLILETINKPEIFNLENTENLHRDSIPLANKARVITNFNRYKPVDNKQRLVVKKEEIKYSEIIEDVKVNNIAKNNDKDVVIIAAPYIEKRQDVSHNLIKEIEKIENSNLSINDINNNNFTEQEYDVEINDLYPVSYKKLLKRKGIDSKTKKKQLKIQKVKETIDKENNPNVKSDVVVNDVFENKTTKNNIVDNNIVYDEVVDNSPLEVIEEPKVEEERMLFDHTDDDLEKIVRWVKYHKNKH